VSLEPGRRDADRGGVPIAPLARILLADDHPATRTGIRVALEEGGFEVCAEAGDAEEAIQAALREEPDLCLLDVRMPAGGGIRAAAEISERVPSAAIVMLTVSLEESDLFDSLRAGADGYLLKDTDPDRLPFALQGVLDGEAALPRTLAARVIEEFRSRDGRRRLLLERRHGAKLTAREWEGLEALRLGRSTAEMARDLHVSPVTVRRHVSGIVRKLRVRDRAAAVRLIDRRRLPDRRSRADRQRSAS
jgi:DNA-binding NarL/FixJ family response regulator